MRRKKPNPKSKNPQPPEASSKAVSPTVVDLVFEQKLAQVAEPLMNKLIDRALEGKLIPLRACIERMLPRTSEYMVTLPLGPVETAEDVSAALTKVVRGVAKGRLTPTEGQLLANILEAKRRALETARLEQRVAALEDAVDPKP